MRRRQVLKTVPILGATSLLGLSACGGGTSGGNTNGQGSASITFLTQQGSFNANVFETFRTENPDINLEVQEVPGDAFKQQVRSLTNTGNLPDLLTLPGGPDGEDLVLAEATMDLADALNTPAYDQESDWIETFRDGVLEEASATFLTQDMYANGEQWFVPQSLLSVVAVYNADIFDEVGIVPPTTWEEFSDSNAALRAAGYAPLSANMAENPDWWPKMVWSQTAPDVTREQVESGEVLFTDPSLVEALEIVQSMFERDWFVDGALTNGVEEEQALFLSGETAQLVHTPNIGQYVEQNAPFEVRAFVLPGVKDIDPTRPVGGTTSNLVVSADTDQPDAAILFAKYMTSVQLYEAQVDQFMLSPLAEQPAGSDIYNTYAEAIEGGAAVSQTWFQTFDPANYDELNTQIYPNVFTGEITPEAAASRIEELFRQ